jgi:hypothetical protein
MSYLEEEKYLQEKLNLEFLGMVRNFLSCNGESFQKWRLPFRILQRPDFALAVDALTVESFFAQLYADTSVKENLLQRKTDERSLCNQKFK